MAAGSGCNGHHGLLTSEEWFRCYELDGLGELEWLIDRYRVTTNEDSGIINDPNDWGGVILDTPSIT